MERMKNVFILVYVKNLLGHHWFMKWHVAYFTPSRYLNADLLPLEPFKETSVDFNDIGKFVWGAMFMLFRSQYDVDID